MTRNRAWRRTEVKVIPAWVGLAFLVSWVVPLSAWHRSLVVVAGVGTAVAVGGYLDSRAG